MAHFTDENGQPIEIKPIDLTCDPLPESFAALLGDFGGAVDRLSESIHPAEAMLAELEALHA